MSREDLDLSRRAAEASRRDRESGPGTPCAWCGEEIPRVSEQGRRTRADVRTCSKACRQKRARFVRGVKASPEYSRDVSSVDEAGVAQLSRRDRGDGSVALDVERPMAFAYADPPYPGFAHLYEDHPDYAGEVDHGELIDRLMDEYRDGWALSTSSKTLAYVLQLCTERGIGACSAAKPFQSVVRVGSWVRPIAPRKAYRAFTAWEPVVFYGGRPTLAVGLLDWVYAAQPRDYPGQIVGIKPAELSGWVFRCLGARPGDSLADLFPGSGAVGRAWEIYSEGALNAA